MNIIELNLKDLKPYEKNPRKNDEAVKYVKESIKQFGFKVPIVVDKDNVIIAGHTRYKASKELGLTKVPCIVADDLTEEQVKAFRLADNKVSEKAEWDFDLLTDELNDILDIDMDLLGFEDLDFDESEKEIIEDENDDLFDDIEKQEKHYGVPYQGNKSRIADIICYILPSGKRLVDLSGGGGAIHIVLY